MREGRRRDELRPLEIVPNFLEQPHGSALISCGKTRVLCTASLEESVPRWLAGRGRGWLTAEYSLLPASTGERTQREARSGRQQGRTVEIQRLIGRSVRAVADLEALGERTLWLDCDVLQADGGTRCASISGVYVAAMLALDRFGLSKALTGSVAAVSVGVVDGEALLDLDYEEDSGAEVDVNVVTTGVGDLIEVQATAERVTFTRERLDELLDLAAGRDRGDHRGAARSPRRLILRLASSNANKARELERAVPAWKIELLEADDYPPEDGETYYDNALIKARFGRRFGAGSDRARRGLRDRGRPRSAAIRASTPHAG